ncbi:AMP-binding protein [Pseudidiomarina halophila]|uniref:AMP-binding protein n=1 Tax=Pseudidiomarina halophila TaxID=1449799 RepID=UPI001300334C|nr:AMP-binding protein [Pseudidiomarina halophila]
MWLKSDTKHWQLELAPALAQRVAAAQAYVERQPEQTWLVYHQQRSSFVIWLLALIAAGRTPLLPGNGRPETLRLAARLADRELVDTAVPTPASATILHAPHVLTGNLDAELVLFTSGSSGVPQAVHKSLRQLFTEVATLETTFGAQLGDCQVVSTITHQHIYGLLFTVLWPLCTGREVAAKRIEYPEQWLAFQRQTQQPYALVSSPAQLERFTQDLDLREFSSKLRAVFSSGGPLHESVPARCVAAAIASPIEVYGSTETGGIAWRQRQHAKQPFRLLPGIKAQADANGQLQLRSPHLGAADIDSDGWYTTADLVHFMAADTFIVEGRADRIIKLAEKRLSLTEVEQFTAQLDWVAQAHCCVMDGDKRVELGLVVQLNELGQRRLAQEGKFALRQVVRQHLNQRFETVVLPRKFRYVTRLPYNEAGKLTQAALQQIFHSDSTAAGSS